MGRWLRRVWSWRLFFVRPRPSSVQQLAHVHQWGACRFNGQYWYARCMTEWCTARIAC